MTLKGRVAVKIIKIEWKTCFRIGLTVLLIYLGISYIGVVQSMILNLLGTAMPLVIGCAIAYVINILMSFYERNFFPHTRKKFINRIRRPICMFFATLSLAAIIFAVVSLILPQFIECIRIIIESVPGLIDWAVIQLEKFKYAPASLVEKLSQFDWNNFVSMASGYFGDFFNVAMDIVTGVFSGVVSAFLSVIFAFYLLFAKDRLGRQINRILDCYFSQKVQKKTRYIVKVLDESFHKYIVGQCTEAVILGVLCTLGMLLLRLPYATMIGALAAFTALIPIFGAYVGAVLGAFMIATASPIDALVFLLFIIILQQIESNLIYPRVVGSSIGLPAIWVLAAVTIGGGVLGVAGMIIGVPLAAAVYRILRHDIRKKVKAFEEAHDENNNSDTESETIQDVKKN